MDAHGQGWLYCAGAELDEADYRALHAVIGGNHGSGNGRFRLPDLRGRFTRGVDLGDADQHHSGMSLRHEYISVTYRFHRIAPPADPQANPYPHTRGLAAARLLNYYYCCCSTRGSLRRPATPRMW
ncbi:phage tail protein [Micromonospora sp. NPDC048935]|uniref:phage tail protein n=1 Tax=Micromonospora sp. NPDC048935 TaxID=3364262 RepID=UPI003710BC14